VRYLFVFNASRAIKYNTPKQSVISIKRVMPERAYHRCGWDTVALKACVRIKSFFIEKPMKGFRS